MVAIDRVKWIVGIIGSPGNLVGASLLQNRGSIHHSEDGVGAVCERGGVERQSIRFIWSIWFILCSSSAEPDKPNKPEKPDELDGPDPCHVPQNAGMQDPVLGLALFIPAA
jgi:hypothetical protein